MKKLITAGAALTLAVFVVGQSQAAPAKDPYCKFANTQKNPVAWNAHYHCLGTQPKPVKAVAQKPAHPRNPYCAFASAQRNVVAWNAYYGCLSR